MEVYERLRETITENFSWSGKFEVEHGYGVWAEKDGDDLATPEKPNGNFVSTGEVIDMSINGQYVNQLGQLIDNGDDNYDYVILLSWVFDSESSGPVYNTRKSSLGNNIFTTYQGEPAYDRDDTDQDGTKYNADDLDSENFTVKVFDATGWPSTPGCIEDPGCEANNPAVYKGSATNPTTVIITGSTLSLGNGQARTYLTEAAAEAIMEAIQ
jgi:hypothetical protein